MRNKLLFGNDLDYLLICVRFVVESLPMSNIRTRYFAILALVFLQQLACGATLQDKIKEIISRKDQNNVQYSIMVLDAQTGNCVFSDNPLRPLTPASNMKLVTSFTTLKRLGENYNFVTKAGLIDQKLVVIGSGDPLLGLPGKDFITKIVDSLKAKGINKLDGVIIDSSIFDGEYSHPNWPKAQLNRPYACEISGLNYNGNCIKITATNNAGKIKLAKEPNTMFLRLLNNVSAISKGETAIGANRTEQENMSIVYGKCKNTASFDVAIERPSLFFGYLLCESLGRAGVAIANPAVTEAGVNPQNMQIVAEFNTPIMEVLHNCNKDSLHIAAEALLKTLAASSSGGKAGSWQGGRNAIDSYLASLGASKGEYYIDDGSGLSSVNKLSANVLTKVLLDAYKSPLWPAFKQTLAVGGVDGTIKKQFYKAKYKNRVFAKTGYISGVRALSGVCVTLGTNKEYIFSIVTNNANYPTKKAIFDIVQSIMDSQ
jgi:D-alanyl-D-alanine carboxypeptidase/D-alanyl-D-alanine-endopeptidase (penicillin-binding protein 4)